MTSTVNNLIMYVGVVNQVFADDDRDVFFSVLPSLCIEVCIYNHCVLILLLLIL